ncbi:uncharacterized protein Z519_05410 [Cladophialophora bantiana CBS 173.52]|uniref:Uncharacterized protein n=1 Tax=Cladophialophora bantiana (strain ATCC 10958 / CBS 173.52 / CDC B-1940 / NIH 8579) TaxID=1442370 RepID=A0A0D2IB93_CLAB1|nr:uncharacterized protein Z519_05410 [Cladophialophora bantiana CBS 173.52]KIW94094.1 hypothetical protein Z519_05410 [Cladophialophora bantiana CBS 173.52]
MSRAYARLCSVLATLLTPDVNNIPMNGIWARIEFPELVRTTSFDHPLGQVESVSVPNALPGHASIIFRVISRPYMIELDRSLPPGLNLRKH